MSLRIKTPTSDLEIDGGCGHSLLQLAQTAGVQVNARCASEGVCGGCTVILQEGQFVVADQRITVTADAPRQVLACRTKLASHDATIRFPRKSIVEQEAKIDDEFRIADFQHEAQTCKYLIQVPEPDAETRRSCLSDIRHELQRRSGRTECEFPIACLQKIPQALQAGGQSVTVTVGRTCRRWSVIDVEPGDTRAAHFGVGIDIGTTTVVAILLDLNEGCVLKRASLYNQQIRLADDVASRITLCHHHDNVHELQRLIVEETVNPLIEQLCAQQGISAGGISRIAVSGNTVMTHLLLGISPASIGHVPFQPLANRYQQYRGRDLRLNINPDAIVDVVPSVSGYVGGDIVSDIYVARLSERAEPTLLVDIGTNGEIVYSESGAYSACATAAGPAFEGYGTAHGCRAAAGAIEQIAFGSDLNFQTQVIGGGNPSGICGSAFIDFIAQGMRCGLINPMGRLNIRMLRDASRYLQIQEMCGPINACAVVDARQSASGEAIYISERDIAQILKAKAAIYAGMKTLLGVRRKHFSEIQRFCLAGGFARYIDLRNAIFIGLLPEIPLDRFDVIGNGSLAGAMLAVVDADAMDAYQTVARLPEVVELNRVASFENHFIDALALPNFDPNDFPNVMTELEATHRETS